MNFNYENPFQDPFMSGISQGQYGQPTPDYSANSYPQSAQYQQPGNQYAGQVYGSPYQPQQGNPYQQPSQQPYGSPYQPQQDPFAVPQYQPQQGNPYQQPSQPPYGSPYQPPYQPQQDPFAAPQYQPQQGNPYQQPVQQPYGSPYQQPYQPQQDPFAAPQYQPQQGNPYQQPVQQPYGSPYQPPQGGSYQPQQGNQPQQGGQPYAAPNRQPQYQPQQGNQYPQQGGQPYAAPEQQQGGQYSRPAEQQSQQPPQSEPVYQPATQPVTQPKAAPAVEQRVEPSDNTAAKQPNEPEKTYSPEPLEDDFLNSVLNEISHEKSSLLGREVKPNADFLDSILNFDRHEQIYSESPDGAKLPEEPEIFMPETAKKVSEQTSEPVYSSQQHDKESAGVADFLSDAAEPTGQEAEPHRQQAEPAPVLAEPEAEPEPELTEAQGKVVEMPAEQRVEARPDPVFAAEEPEAEAEPEAAAEIEEEIIEPSPAAVTPEQSQDEPQDAGTDDVKEYIPGVTEIPREKANFKDEAGDIVELLPEEPELEQPEPADVQPSAGADRELAREAAEQNADIVEDTSGVDIQSLSAQMRMQLNEQSIPPKELLPEEDSVFGLDTNELIKRAYAVGTEELVRDSLDTAKRADEQSDPRFAAKEYLRAKERRAAEEQAIYGQPDAMQLSAEPISQPEPTVEKQIEQPAEVAQAEPMENCLFKTDTELDEYGEWFVCRNQAPEGAESAVVAVDIACNLFYEGGAADKSRVVSNATFKVLRGSVCGFAADRAYDSFTLMSVIAGCRHFDGGSLSILGNNVEAKELVEMPNLLYIDGTDVFDHGMTVGETLALALAYSPKVDVDRLVDECGFQDLIDTKVRLLTVAQKAALYMMSACASSLVEIVAINIPELSFRGNDNKYLIGVIKRLRSDGKTVLISTVSSDYMDEVADSVVYMMGGKVVYSGAVSDFCCAASKIILAAKCRCAAKVAEQVKQLVPELFVKTGDDGFIVCNGRTMFDSAKFEEMIKRQAVSYGEIVARPLCFLAAVNEVFNR